MGFINTKTKLKKSRKNSKEYDGFIDRTLSQANVKKKFRRYLAETGTVTFYPNRVKKDEKQCSDPQSKDTSIRIKPMDNNMS